jgi:hypothetical protein
MKKFLLPVFAILTISSCKYELAQPEIKAPENLINSVWYDTEPFTPSSHPPYALHFITVDSGYVQDAIEAYKYPMGYYYYDGKLKLTFIDGNNDSQRIVGTVLGKYLYTDTDTFLRVK